VRLLTRQGWLLTGIAVALLVAGRLLGTLELFLLGVISGLLVLGCAIYVRTQRPTIDLARELHPPRVHAGTPSRVDLRVSNQGTRPTPVLGLRDAVSRTRGARLIVGPLEPGTSVRAAYRLPTDRRGVIQIGPLETVRTDPFGLASITTKASGVSELTIYPHIDEVRPIPQTTGNDPMAGADHPNALGRSGEDFYALRRYVVGDDLRRVHWPSTARHDELMVRQDELPWQARATLLVDVRATTNTADSLELLVSAAASIVNACGRRQDLIRLVNTDGTDSGFAAGHAHIDSIMEHLASVEASPDPSFRLVVDRLARSSTGGALVVLVAAMPSEELDQLSRLRNRFGSVLIVQFDRSAWDPTVPSAAPAPGRERILRVTGTSSFPDVWNAAVRARRPEHAVRRPAPNEHDGPDEDRWATRARIRP
jgi:uncharacterized protein (DUF58 family)